VVCVSPHKKWVALGWHCGWWHYDIDQPQYHKCLSSFFFIIFFCFLYMCDIMVGQCHRCQPVFSLKKYKDMNLGAMWNESNVNRKPRRSSSSHTQSFINPLVANSNSSSSSLSSALILLLRFVLPFSLNFALHVIITVMLLYLTLILSIPSLFLVISFFWVLYYGPFNLETSFSVDLFDKKLIYNHNWIYLFSC